MLKRISAILTTLLLFVLFTIPAFADENVKVESSSQTQTSDSTVTQNQNVDSGGTADNIEQDQESKTDKIQNQNASPGGTLEQNQTTSVNASQNQVVENADQLDAKQTQNIDIDASQSQSTSIQQEQSTEIETSQKQSIVANETKKAEQNQSVNIENTQEQMLSETTDEESNATDVNAHQKQELESQGKAKLNQNQKVTLSAEEIAAETTTKVIINVLVKVFQKIDVNGEIITHEDKFKLGDDSYKNELSKSYTYEWGTVSVVNKILVEKGENDFIHTWMESIINIQRNRPEPPPVVDTPEIDNSSPEDSDGDGLTDEEEFRLGLDPYNRDTDGDELTDYFEVIYYVPGVLDPLNKDTDNDKIIDRDEDPDNDGFTNFEEQANGTNPHVSNN